MPRTMDDVIEAHRQAIGAERVHVSLRSEATPENVARGLAEFQVKIDLFNAFRREEQLEAQVERLRQLIHEVADLGRRGETEQIMQKTGLIADVDLEGDLRCMFDARVKRGEPVPEGAAGILKEIEAKEASRPSA